VAPELTESGFPLEGSDFPATFPLKSNVHVTPRPGPGYLEGLPAGSPPPVRSSDPNVQNTPSPAPEGGKYVGNVGDNPIQPTSG